MKLANLLYQSQLNRSKAIVENQKLCIDEINRLVDQGKFYFYYDKENNTIILKTNHNE